MKTVKKTPIPTGEPVDSLALLAKNRVFTVEFKRAAVERMQQDDISPTALALELGIRRNQLYKWAKALQGTAPGDAVRGRGRVPADQESELVRLRRKLAGVEEELAILKKFDAYLTQLKK
jgi:transposase